MSATYEFTEAELDQAMEHFLRPLLTEIVTLMQTCAVALAEHDPHHDAVIAAQA